MKKLVSNVTRVELKAINKTDNGYSVFLFTGCRVTFSTKREANQFLKEKSIQLNRFINTLNLFYLEVLNTCQPYLTSLSCKQIREYTEKKKNIDDQLCFILSIYHGGCNHTYFKNLDYIMSQVSQLLKVYESVPEISDKVKFLQSKTPERLW